MQNEKGQLVIVSRPNQQQTQMRPNLNQPNQQRPQQLRPNSVPIVAAQTGAVTSSSHRASQMLPQQKIVASRSKTNVINSPGAAALSSASTKRKVSAFEYLWLNILVPTACVDVHCVTVLWSLLCCFKACMNHNVLGLCTFSLPLMLC